MPSYERCSTRRTDDSPTSHATATVSERDAAVGEPEAVFLSYRLGGADGVAVEAAKWDWALRELGFSTRRVAGELEGTTRPDDTWLAFLAIEPVDGAPLDPGALAAALAGADLVIVENLCSLPLNLQAATLTREVLDRHRGRVLFHHHDFAWERPHLAHLSGFPPDRSSSLHVTISEHGRAALRSRGFDATRIPNSFDFDAFDGDRVATRRDMGYEPDHVVVLQPTRAIPRKNVAGGLRFTEAVASLLPSRVVHYWITGPAEDGFDEEFERLLATARIPVRVGRAPRSVDAYAAADVVVFPSLWEGFGNPVVESTAARRMVATAWYPVLDEITAGLDVLSIDAPEAAARWLTTSDVERAARLDANYRNARERFSLEHLPNRIADAFSTVGWADW
jgi:glycosyltransferase involved in cell wall biosynthesis